MDDLAWENYSQTNRKEFQWKIESRLSCSLNLDAGDADEIVVSSKYFQFYLENSDYGRKNRELIATN